MEIGKCIFTFSLDQLIHPQQLVHVLFQWFFIYLFSFLFEDFCSFLLGHMYFFPQDRLMQSLGCFLQIFQFYCRIKSLMKNLQYLINFQYMCCKLIVVRSCAVVIKKNYIQAFISTHSFCTLEEESCYMAGVVK